MFYIVHEFEQKIANFYGAPYAVATDCCTHAIELCLHLTKPKDVRIPEHTYISIPFTLMKLNLSWNWDDVKWMNFYKLGNTNIIDAAVYWKENSYVPGSLMCLSFQFKKHLSLGRGGAILTDNKESYIKLKRMSYDGRDITSNIPWTEQLIDEIGYHYYMTPETAQAGLNKLPYSIANKNPRQWDYTDYPYLPSLPVFKNV
jgi:dTDP-4-amino-4,6-dideoxygalactose transaminase